ncbi:MAG: peptidoglycan-associated lipoprotein Pal [Parvibaculales bacterium]
MVHKSITKLAAMVMMSFALAACATDGDSVYSNVSSKEGTVRELVRNVGDRVFFETDSSVLTASARDTLSKQAQWLRSNSVDLVIEGHADERGTRDYNLGLGARRASAVKDFMVSLGVDPSRLSTVSYGKERPVSLCANESCWSKNRRTVSVIR